MTISDGTTTKTHTVTDLFADIMDENGDEAWFDDANNCTVDVGFDACPEGSATVGPAGRVYILVADWGSYCTDAALDPYQLRVAVNGTNVTPTFYFDNYSWLW